MFGVDLKQYDPDLPLVFIHVPKTAGGSVRTVFRNWFGQGFYAHYFNWQHNQLPHCDPRFETHTRENPVCVYGHFNQKRGFGVDVNYPDAKQFMTILRDPFEQMVSRDFDLRSKSDMMKKYPNGAQPPEGTLEAFLLSDSPNTLSHLPRPVTQDNYRDIIDELFIYIGCTEELSASMQKIASSLGYAFHSSDLGVVIVRMTRYKVFAMCSMKRTLWNLKSIIMPNNGLALPPKP